MNFLQEHYRQLLNNWNFSRENRLIFQEGETPKPAETEKKGEVKPAEVIPSSEDAPKVADKKVEQTEEQGDKANQNANSNIDTMGNGGPSKKPAGLETKDKTPTKEKPKETAEQKKAKTKFIEDNLSTLMKRLSTLPDFKSLNSENPQMQEMAKELLAVMSKDKLIALKEGKMDITKEEKGKMEKIAVSHIKETIGKGDKIEKGEPELLDDWADELNLPYEDQLEGGKPLNKIIALKFKIEKGDKDDEIKINGDVVKNKDELMAKIKAEDSDLSNKLEAYEKGTEYNKENLLKGLEKYAGDNVEAHEAMAKMAESLDSPEAIKKLGGLAGLFALLQLLPTIMKALKDGDFSVVNEMLADYKRGENPAKKISESKKNYTSFFEKGDGKNVPLKTLLSIYKDPKTSNKDANDLFCKGKSEEEIKQDPLGRYRFMAKPAIKGKFVEKLGLGRIEEIKLEEGVTEIDGYKRDTGKRVSIRLYEEGGRLQANIRNYISIPQKDGSKVEEKEEKGKPVADANWDKIKIALGGKAATDKPDEGKGKQEVADGLTTEQREQIKKKITEIIKAIRGELNNKDVKVKVLYDMNDSSYKISISSKDDKVLAKASFKPSKDKESEKVALAKIVSDAKNKIVEKEVPYEESELDTSGKRLAIVKAAGKLDEFKTAYRAAKPHNAAKWGKNWIMNIAKLTKKPTPKPTPPQQQEIDQNKAEPAEPKPKPEATAEAKSVAVAPPQPEPKPTPPQQKIEPVKSEQSKQEIMTPEPELFKEQLAQISDMFKGSEIKFENGEYKFNINGIEGDFTIQKLRPDLPYVDNHEITINFPEISKIIKNVKKKNISSKIIEAVKTAGSEPEPETVARNTDIAKGGEDLGFKVNEKYQNPEDLKNLDEYTAYLKQSITKTKLALDKAETQEATRSKKVKSGGGGLDDDAENAFTDLDEAESQPQPVNPSDTMSILDVKTLTNMLEMDQKALREAKSGAKNGNLGKIQYISGDYKFDYNFDKTA